MVYLRQVALAFAAIAAAAGLAVRVQIGEPWWWIDGNGRIHLYDAAAAAAFDPAPIPDMRAPLNEAQKATLDAAGATLAGSTAALGAAVKAAHPGAEILLLAYLPTVLDPAMPEAKRANLPLAWAAPAFDVLQLEDYQWVTEGRTAASARARAEVEVRLGYPASAQHYLAGFVLSADERAGWRPIAAAAEGARIRGVAETFIWALPQVLRDGFTIFGEEQEMEAFDDVRFPVALGRDATVEPAFSTDVVATTSGAEQRNSAWADARMRFDVGTGLRSEQNLRLLLDFFRARRGAAIGFRFADPLDNSSNGTGGAPGATDQMLGSGDGVRSIFPLVKRYGTQERRITRPVIGTVRVSIDGVERTEGWTLADAGRLVFDPPPVAGAEVAAGFSFDVPVRFAEDRLAVSLATFRAGEAASVPLIEIREGLE